MKLNKILFVLAAGVMTLAGCAKMEKVTVKLGESTAPVIESNTVTPEVVTVKYTPAVMKVGDENVKPDLVIHTLAIVKVTKDDQEVVVNATVTSEDNHETNTVTAEASAFSSVLVGLGYAYGDKVNLEVALRAQLSTVAHSGYLDAAEPFTINDYTIKKPVSRGGRYAEFSTLSTWGVTGSIASAGISWDKDIPMYSNGKWHVAEGVELKASDAFKFRNNGKWDENFGAATGIDTEPYPVTLDAKQDGGANGKNLCVSEDGVYDLLLNPEAKMYLVVKHIDDPTAKYDKLSTWGVTGSISTAGISWDSDIPMYTDGTLHVAKGVELKASDAFKFRNNGKWDENFGAATGIETEPFPVTLDEEQDAGANGKNLGVPEDGKFDLFLDPVNKKYKVSKSTVYPDLPLD